MFVIIGFIAFSINGFGQRLLEKDKNGKLVTLDPKAPQSKATIKDTLVKNISDTLKKEQDITNTVVYSAKDSTIMDTEAQEVYLYGSANVTYGDVKLDADFIKLSWAKNEVYAKGMFDSTSNKLKGTPIFTQGGEPYDAEEIRYNFKSKKAIIKAIITKQDDGFIHGEKVKKDNEDNLYISNAKYTTCNLEHPHFYIKAKKIKLVGKKEIVSGPFNIVLNDIPLPIGLPFGFFPYQQRKENGTSGIIMPSYGEDQERGFYLLNGGYYWAASEHIGVTLTSQLYTKGSWGLTANSQYIKKYRYSGSLSASFNRNITGNVIASNSNDQFSFQWSHQPQRYGNMSTFSTSVNLQSSGFGSQNSFNTQSYIQNSSNSSIQYAKNFGEKVSFSINSNAVLALVPDNSRTYIGNETPQESDPVSTQVDVTTGFSLGVTQLTPFLKKSALKERFMDQFRLGLSLSGNYVLSNKIDFSQQEYNNVSYRVNRKIDSTTFKDPNNNTSVPSFERDGLVSFFGDFGKVQENAKTTLNYSVPISLPNIKLGKYINLSPSMSLNGNIYTRKFKYQYIESSSEKFLFNKNDTTGAIIVERDQSGFNTDNFDYSTSFSVSTNTRLYGTLNFKKGRLSALRHVMSPSISASWAPDLKDKFYEKVQINTFKDPSKNEYKYISRFDPTRTLEVNQSSESGGLSFGLQNTLEAKIKAKTDTAKNDYEKISIIDNLSISTNYNFFAKAYKLSNISMNANSRVKKFDINMGATFDPYMYQQDISRSAIGKRLDKLSISNGGGLANLSNFNLAISKSFSPSKKQEKKSANASENDVKQINKNIDNYVDWSIPWNFRFSYQYNYSKEGFAPVTSTSNLSFSGDLKMTEHWNFNLSSGYDFDQKSVTFTTISLQRNLHCWVMEFSWTPVANPRYGRVSNYNFDLRVNSSLLSELKLSRRKLFSDRSTLYQ
ncbi:MAG: LPS-assembly protein LptD [Pseudarcicella sp.]|nr:LPS-assembly protein LptD [Pseudarcicella sp.]